MNWEKLYRELWEEHEALQKECFVLRWLLMVAMIAIAVTITLYEHALDSTGRSTLEPMRSEAIQEER